jgi:hypothetical protein
LKFDPAILGSACQDIMLQTNGIVCTFLSTIQQLQVKRLSPNFLQGSTIVLFNHIQKKAQFNDMELQVLAPSDLFQIDIILQNYHDRAQCISACSNDKSIKLLKFFSLSSFRFLEIQVRI